MKKIFLIGLVFCCFQFAFASVDTIEVYSNAMHKNVKTVVVTPTSYKKKKNVFPVVYLLHGYSDSYNGWIKKVPKIEQYANDYQVMIVCPDGGFSSWYLDSPIDSTYKYETFVASELVSFIDAHYRTKPNVNSRAITGLSMGGHGGLFLGLRHADLFGACGSMSGGVDLHYSTRKFDVAKRIGDTVRYANNWNDYSVLWVVEKYTQTKQKIIFDCGVDDFFYNDNKALHAKMVQLKIQHDYIERPGGHTWPYWANAVQYQLLFFNNFFNAANAVAK